MKYWTLNDDRRIVALVGFWNVLAGDVGGVVPESTVLPTEEQPLWIGHTARIGKNITLSAATLIKEGAKIEARVEIGSAVIIGENTQVCYRSIIRSDCIIGADCRIGDWSAIGPCNSLADYTKLGQHSVIP